MQDIGFYLGICALIFLLGMAIYASVTNDRDHHDD